MRHFPTVLLAALVWVGLTGCTGEGELGAAGKGAPKLAYRINCGAEKDYVDQNGTTWLADQVLDANAPWGAMAGLTILRTGMTIPETKSPDVYVNERYSMDGYQFAVPPGTYTVRLHFAETYEGIEAAGERVFSVKINGQAVLTDLDVLKETVGLAKPLVKTAAGLKVPDGKIKIEFVANVQNPEINAIEVLGH